MMMKLGGKCLIGLGLFLFGMIDWWIPVACIIGGIVTIEFADEYNL